MSDFQKVPDISIENCKAIVDDKTKTINLKQCESSVKASSGKPPDANNQSFTGFVLLMSIRLS